MIMIGWLGWILLAGCVCRNCGRRGCDGRCGHRRRRRECCEGRFEREECCERVERVERVERNGCCRF